MSEKDAFGASAIGSAKQGVGDEAVSRQLDASMLGEALKLVFRVIDSCDVSLDEKINALRYIQSKVEDKYNDVSKLKKRLALGLWEDRSDYHMLPSDFVKLHYPSYGRGLTQADIRNSDSKLYTALQNQKIRKGWPGDFNLPSRKEAFNELAAKLDANGLLNGRTSDDPIMRRKKRNTRNFSESSGRE